MTDPLRVILEIGKKRRVVAGAMDWPGLDRGGTSEDDALAKLEAYLPRYARVADRAGLSTAFKRTGPMMVVERVPGSSSTDFWGIAHVPSEIEREVLSSRDLERRIDAAPGLVGLLPRHGFACLRGTSLGPRSAGRTRERSSAMTTPPSPTTSGARSRSGPRGGRLDTGRASRPSGGVSRCDPGLQRRGQAGAHLADPVPHPPHGPARDGPRLGDGGPRPQRRSGKGTR